MAKTRAQVRASFAALCAALPNWTQSRFASDAFGRDPDSLLSRCFTVGLGTTTNRNPGEGFRGRPGEGLLVDTDLTVKWAYRLTPKDQLASRDAAETAGQELIVACERYDATWPGELKVRLATVASQVDAPGEWFVGTATFRVTHIMPIS